MYGVDSGRRRSLETLDLRTDSERADKDTKNISVASLLDHCVPPHQKFIGLCRLKRGLARHRVVSMDLEAAKKMSRQLGIVRKVSGEGSRTGVVGCVKSRFVSPRLDGPT